MSIPTRIVYILRMDLGEMLIGLGLWLMPNKHPHKAAWLEGRKRAERLIEAAP